jgi:hypothetical protein
MRRCGRGRACIRRSPLQTQRRTPERRGRRGPAARRKHRKSRQTDRSHFGKRLDDLVARAGWASRSANFRFTLLAAVCTPPPLYRLCSMWAPTMPNAWRIPSNLLLFAAYGRASCAQRQKYRADRSGFSKAVCAVACRPGGLKQPSNDKHLDNTNSQRILPIQLGKNIALTRRLFSAERAAKAKAN